MQFVIELTDEMDARVRTRAADLGFGSGEDHVLAIVNAEVDAAASDPLDDPRLEALLVGRLDGPDAGPMTDADFDRIRQRAGLPVTQDLGK